MEGKVKQALKFVDSENDVSGIHKISEDVEEILQVKNLEDEISSPDALINQVPIRVEEVIFEKIDGQSIQEAAKRMNGSDGPSQIVADI